MPGIPEIKRLFEPRSIAVIGASQHPEKIGYRIIENIRSGGYAGKIYPINPSGGEILGIPAYKSLSDVEGEIDLACITIPAKITFRAVEECAAKHVGFMSIITSGFSEVGNLDEERKIVRFSRENGMRVLGPNIFGIYSSVVSMNATFGPKDVSPGHVAIVTQSGALGIAMMGKTKIENIGLSAIVSVGNKSDVDETDLLRYLIDHDDTKVILMYIEGVKNGEALVGLLCDATKKKPVIVIKSGRSKRGAVAAASHTGSLAGADEIFSDIMRQCGVIRAESIQEALNWCKYLSSAPAPAGENAIIITNGGGMGVLAADACEKYGVALYDDVKTMSKIFSTVVPDFGSFKNPVDITGQARIEDYEHALDAAFANDAIHSVICLGCEAAVFDISRLPETMNRFVDDGNSAKPVVFSFFGGEKIENMITNLKKQNIPVYHDVYEAVSNLGALYLNHRNVHREMMQSPPQNIDDPAIDAVITKVRADERQFLLSYEAEKVMTAAGIRMPRTRLAKSIGEAVRHAEDIGYPVVMKVVSRDIVHKSDAGGVALDIDDKKEVMEAFESIMHNCRAHSPNARIEGIEVAEMVRSGGTETIIGGRRDPAFGPVVMFGLGGIYVEVMKDVSFRAFPLDRNEAMSMVSGIRSYPLLLGVRGEKRKDINGVVDVILKVGAILLHHPEITDIEVNPLIAYDEGQGVMALDARILISKPEEAS